MRASAEKGFVWAILLSVLAFAGNRAGLPDVIFSWAHWAFLVLAGMCALALIYEARSLRWAGNRFNRNILAWLLATIAAFVIWTFADKAVMEALPFLQSSKKLWKALNPFAEFFGFMFLLLALGLMAIGAIDKSVDRPKRLERTFAVNMSAKIAAVPMVLTALCVFVGATLWTVYHSFTKSKLLPKSEFVGLDQYERLWNTDRWYISIENLAIYGFFSMVFSLVIGFMLAALLDQKIRFENTFRTILLYPFALSFIVTGLVWQWLLNPDLGIQKIVRGFGFENFTFDPLYNADIVIYGVLVAGLWQGTGFIMCLMLAGLRGIDEDIWKAARVDGIPMWKTYLFVVIPMMRPVFITTLVIIASGIVRVYDLIVAQTSGGPGLASEVPAKYVYDYMFGGQNLGQGFAASTMMLLSVLVIVIPWAFLEFGGRKRDA